MFDIEVIKFDHWTLTKDIPNPRKDRRYNWHNNPEKAAMLPAGLKLERRLERVTMDKDGEEVVREQSIYRIRQKGTYAILDREQAKRISIWLEPDRSFDSFAETIDLNAHGVLERLVERGMVSREEITGINVAVHAEMERDFRAKTAKEAAARKAQKEGQ